VIVDPARHELLLRTPVAAAALAQAFAAWSGRYADAGVLLEAEKDPAGVPAPLRVESELEAPGRVRLRLRLAP
jgi:hypothetical protein